MTREELRRRGDAMRARLFGDSAGAVSDPVMVETTYGAIWSRPGLPLEDRMVCTLAALCAVREVAQLRRYVAAAIDIGLPHPAPFAIFAQIGIYAGFGVTESACTAAEEIFRGRRMPVPKRDAPDEALDVLDARGREVMSTLHGERGARGYASPDNALTNRLYPLTIAYGYGEIWQRPGLAFRQRVMVSLAGFTALQLTDQLKKFGPSALNVGLTLDEVCEAIIQTAPYSGYAPALNALRWLSEALQIDAK